VSYAVAIKVPVQLQFEKCWKILQVARGKLNAATNFRYQQALGML